MVYSSWIPFRAQGSQHKLYPAAFGDNHNNIIPDAHVSGNKKSLIRQVRESKADIMILKPPNGYGGSVARHTPSRQERTTASKLAPGSSRTG